MRRPRPRAEDRRCRKSAVERVYRKQEKRDDSTVRGVHAASVEGHSLSFARKGFVHSSWS